MIDVRDVTKRYEDFAALQDVSLQVPAGSLTALLGPSGSGKSTLLRVIAGLEEPDDGQVLIEGDDATRLPARRRGVGFVFQHYAAFKHMTVRANVAFGLKVRRRPKAEIRERVDELLALVHLGGWADRYPSQLSGGQRQRMALARALAVEPRVLLLDEPFGALDAQVREELRIWLRRLHEEVHVTTVFVTHDQEEAMDVAEQVAVIDQGRIQQVGTPRDLYEHPANDFVMGFIGPVTRLGDAVVRPHDVSIVTEPSHDTREALVERVAHLSFEVRVELSLDDGRDIWVQLTRAQATELELAPGQIVWVRPSYSNAGAFQAAGSALSVAT
jgi:sulfate/thiosulfate transport system ATP-binding protein